MKKIALFIPDIPLPISGGTRVLHELLLHLQERSEVLVFCPVVLSGADQFRKAGESFSNGTILEGIPVRRSFGSLRGKIGRVLNPLPNLQYACSGPDSHRLVEKKVEEFKPDVILAVSSVGFHFSTFTTSDVLRLLYCLDNESLTVMPERSAGARLLDSVLERWKVARFWRRCLRKADRVGCIAPKVLEVVKRVRPDAQLVYPLMRPRMVDRSDVIPGRLLITTNYRYAPNVESLDWFLKEVWPKVPEEFTLDITGRDSEDGALARRLDGIQRVQYLGLVDEHEFDRCFARAALVVNPTRSGSGFQIKLLDALSRGVPVVSTDFSNPFPGGIPSSDDPLKMAKMISHHALGEESTFPYSEFYKTNCHSWGNIIS